jgi:hypothetical protein
MLMIFKINVDSIKYICTFLQALCLYFHYDEWNGDKHCPKPLKGL